MTIVVVGVLADKLGAASQWVTVPANLNRAGRNFDVRREFSSVPSLEYRSVQPAEIRVDLNHDRPIGELRYLERTEQRLYAVAEIDASSLGEGPWFYSPSIRHYNGKEIELRGLAVTKHPASVGLGPLEAFPGTLRDVAAKIVYQDGHVGELVKKAAEYDRRRKHREPIVIQGLHPQRSAPTLERTSSSPRIEIRSATTVDVHRARRELDLLITPAETPTVIYERGKRYTEVFSHGAFAGVDPDKVKVNRDHVRERVLGKTLRLDPWSEEGLTGTVKIARTRDGDDALALIDDDLLGVSAGFGIPNGGEEWRGRDHRRVRRAVLDHVALVVEAAYPSARVTAVRSTPNLDRARELARR